MHATEQTQATVDNSVSVELLRRAMDCDKREDSEGLADCIDEMNMATFTEWRRREGRDWWATGRAEVHETAYAQRACGSDEWDLDD